MIMGKISVYHCKINSLFEGLEGLLLVIIPEVSYSVSTQNVL